MRQMSQELLIIGNLNSSENVVNLGVRTESITSVTKKFIGETSVTQVGQCRVEVCTVRI